MPEDNVQGGSGVQGGTPSTQGNGGANGGTPNAGAGANNGAGAGQDRGGDSGAVNLQELVNSLRHEATTRRHNETRLQTALETKDTELKQKNDRITELEGAVRNHLLSGVIADAVGKLNTHHAQTIARLVDRSKITIKEDGTVDTATIDAAIATVKTENPTLFGGGGALSRDAGANGGGDTTNGNAAMNSMIRRATGR